VRVAERRLPPVAAPRAAGERLAAVAAYLRLRRIDIWALLGLTLVAFVFRFFSPIMPDLFAHPLSGWPVSDCVQSTPVDAQGHSGTLCGLAYPYQRGFAQPGQKPQPPEGEVFDEIYFAVFAHDDLKGLEQPCADPNSAPCYFDPEPPLAKLMIASGEWGWGWFRATFQGAHGDPADLGFNPFGWRIMSCLFGTLCVPLMYLLARRLWPDRLFAVAAATLTCFDGLFFVQSRIGMIDIFPIFLILLAYLVFLMHWQSATPREAVVTLLLTGIVVGLAISAKWISLAAWGSMLFLLAMRPIVRFADLQFAGPGGVWRWGRSTFSWPVIPGGVQPWLYINVLVVAFLVIPLALYVASWTPFFIRGQFHGLGDLWAYQVQTYQYHANLKATHPYGSPWFSWPFLYRPVAYYYESVGLGTDQFTGRPLVAGIVDLGNPWIWWTSLPCLVAMPYFILRYRSFPAALILLGFITQWLPFSRVTRVLFLYHMFGGLPFMILGLAFTLAWLARSEVAVAGPNSLFPLRYLAYAHLVIAVLTFLYFLPAWTGLPISDMAYLNTGGLWPGKMWYPSWI
jgi:dolichyl-phosphate-mannose-protein mannosyltransferase